MNEDGPNGSPYEMLVKHDQSETKRDTTTANRPNLYSYREQCRHKNNRHHKMSPRQ
jgi:hypothetical protein